MWEKNNNNYKNPQLYGYFKRQTGEISHEKTWQWKENPKKEIECLIIAAQKKRHKDQLC